MAKLMLETCMTEVVLVLGLVPPRLDSLRAFQQVLSTSIRVWRQ